MTIAMDGAPLPELPPAGLQSRWLRRLSDGDLLAALLHSVAATDAPARPVDDLIARLGGLCALAESDELHRCCAGRGGPAGDAALVSAFELGRRAARALPVRGFRIMRAADVAEAVGGLLSGLRRERVVVLVCDAADQLLASVTVSEGALDRAMFPVREILHAVLVHDGRSFAVAHNHPTGDPEPSAADVEVTRAIRDAARVVGLRFLGHVVVVEEGWQEVS